MCGGRGGGGEGGRLDGRRVIQWGLRSGDLFPELMGKATLKVQRLSELGPAVVPAVGGPGASDPKREGIGEIDGVAGAEQGEG